MSSISDTRLTILQIINEVRSKLGIPDASVVTSDKQSITSLNYLNDVIEYVSDYGDWQELRQEVTVTASSSVFSYLINTSAPLKNVYDVYFYNQVAPVRYVEIEDMRRFRRTGGIGVPRNWTINGVDNATTGNPYLEVYPMPGPAENNQTFNLLVYVKPRKYETTDGSIIPPFPARMLVSMLLALMLLDESRGTANIDYRTELSRFDDMIEETLNRFNGDSAGDTQFTPRRGGFRRV
jgi:hypothetical protein